MNTRDTQFLAVFPNPYLLLDGFGNPAGAYPVDPTHNPDRAFVGAKISRVDILDKLERGDLRAPRQDTYFEFVTKEATSVPVTPYYLNALANAFIFPADEKTAALAGVPYKPLDEYYEEACRAARSKWRQDYIQECPLKQFELSNKKVEEKK
jgi:hypothetical protein